MTPALRIRSLTKRYGDVAAADAVDLDAATGSFTAVLGPSGCGKSTLLLVAAGLVRPDHGRVEVDGRDLTDVPAERRPVGLVFQKPLLFPHLSVAQNVGFGLRMLQVPRRERADRVAEMLHRVQLDGLGDRRRDELSGGQEQRVALARALVLRPSVLLLDEPFSQLDTGLRVQMRDLVRELHDDTGVTTVFVTHDQGEAVAVADRIVMMLDGQVEAAGSPHDLYARPPTLATARFLGAVNELRGHAGPDGAQVAGTRVASRPGGPSGDVVLVVRPESLVLGGAGGAGVLPVAVQSVRFAGTHLVVSGHCADGQEVTAHVAVGTRVDVGERVGVTWAPDAATVYGGHGR